MAPPTGPPMTPIPVSAHDPLSMTPAFSHFRIRRMTRLSPMRCSRNVINQSRGIVSKYARRSASTIQLTLRRSIPKARASSASCAPRPGRNP